MTLERFPIQERCQNPCLVSTMMTQLTSQTTLPIFPRPYDFELEFKFERQVDVVVSLLLISISMSNLCTIRYEYCYTLGQKNTGIFFHIQETLELEKRK